MQDLMREPDISTDKAGAAKYDITKDLESERQDWVQIVLQIRARYERADRSPGTGNAPRERQLLSEAVKHLEELDAWLHTLREREAEANTCSQSFEGPKEAGGIWRATTHDG
ncbi:hypothetical protein GCM10027562_03730 [Arthrobacter pigmenti]